MHYGDSISVLTGIQRSYQYLTEIPFIDDVGYTPIHLAAERGYKDILEMLIDYGGHTTFREKPTTANELNDLSATPETTVDEPLRLAIKNGHFDCAELLLKRGANPNAKYFLGSEINFVDPVTQVRLFSLFFSSHFARECFRLCEVKHRLT